MQAVTTSAAATNLDAAPARTSYWTAFRQMPVVLQAYAGFASIMIVGWAIGFALLLWPAVTRQLAPYGGVTSLNAYLFTMYFIFSMPLQPRRRAGVLSLAAIVSIGVWIGAFDMYRLLSDANVTQAAVSTNPFLKYEPVRAPIGIVVPLFWTLMLLSPQVWRWSSGQKTERSSRFSTLDLLYLMMVCAICTALAIGLMGYVRGRLAIGADPLNQVRLPGSLIKPQSSQATSP